MTASSAPQTDPASSSRRTIVKGVAWTVPAVAAASGAPAFAASGCPADAGLATPVYASAAGLLTFSLYNNDTDPVLSGGTISVEIITLMPNTAAVTDGTAASITAGPAASGVSAPTPSNPVYTLTINQALASTSTVNAFSINLPARAWIVRTTINFPGCATGTSACWSGDPSSDAVGNNCMFGS